MKLGEIIKSYRAQSKLTMRELAERCGVSHSYIAMLESEKNSKTGEPITPSLITLKKIADGLGITLNELIIDADDIPVKLSEETSNNTINGNNNIIGNGNTVSNTLTEAEQALLDMYNQMNIIKKSKLIAYASELLKEP